MEEVFKEKREINQWDNLLLDVQQVYKKHPIGMGAANDRKTSSTAFFKQIYSNRILPLKLRRYFRKLACQVHLDLNWFHDFSHYWSNVLGGRPMWGVQDFYFLMNLYRVRFQENRVPDTVDASVHLEAWQRPELLYQLLHLVYKESVTDYAVLVHDMLTLNPHMRSFLEFGCGTAPITLSFLEFFGERRDIKSYFSDIQTVAFHYAAHRFAKHKNAIPLMLTPENDFRPSLVEPVDVITCITVFEHLNQPLFTVKEFHSMLSPGGLFFFDYIKTDGEGMDTIQGANERDAVLDFVAANFDILSGEPSKSRSTGLVIARKK